MNIFESVKAAVTTRQAAEHYGIEVNHHGMARCPFHDDRTPSMKLDTRYHCFGCGADGDVIDFFVIASAAADRSSPAATGPNTVPCAKQSPGGSKRQRMRNAYGRA